MPIVKDQEKREVGRWWLWITLLLLMSVAIFGGARMLGLIGQTAAERVIFEQSYQKQSADNRALATFRANLAEIEQRLISMPASDPRREDLEAQAAGIRVQIRSITGQQ